MSSEIIVRPSYDPLLGDASILGVKRPNQGLPVQRTTFVGSRVWSAPLKKVGSFLVIGGDLRKVRRLEGIGVETITL